MRIDPLKGWHRYSDLMAQQPTPEGRAMLDNMRHHLKFECLGDPAIFETMVPEPVYRFFGGYGNTVLEGMEAVQQFYRDIWDSRSSLVELAIHRCAVADWGVACDGEWWQQMPGDFLAAQGTPDVDTGRWYVSHAHLSWFFPFENIDGRTCLQGEICYLDEAGSSLEAINDEDVLSLDAAQRAWAELD